MRTKTHEQEQAVERLCLLHSGSTVTVEPPLDDGTLLVEVSYTRYAIDRAGNIERLTREAICVG